MSCFGCTLQQLVEIPSPLRDSPLQTGGHGAASWNAGIDSRDGQLQLEQQAVAVAPLSIPKEVWRMVDWLYQRLGR